MPLSKPRYEKDGSGKYGVDDGGADGGGVDDGVYGVDHNGGV